MYSSLDFSPVVLFHYLVGHIPRYGFAWAKCDRIIHTDSSVDISIDHTLEFPMEEYSLLLNFCSKFAHTDRHCFDTIQRISTMTMGVFVAAKRENQFMSLKNVAIQKRYGLPCECQGYSTCLQLWYRVQNTNTFAVSHRWPWLDLISLKNDPIYPSIKNQNGFFSMCLCRSKLRIHVGINRSYQCHLFGQPMQANWMKSSKFLLKFLNSYWKSFIRWKPHTHSPSISRLSMYRTISKCQSSALTLYQNSLPNG